MLLDYRTARRASLVSRDLSPQLARRRHSPQMIRRLVRIHGERSAVRDRVTPQMFRHSVATYPPEEGVDIRYV
jgi:site-specific recombinase XerD